MAYDPLSDVFDAPLVINGTVLRKLREIPRIHKFHDLPGENPARETLRLQKMLDQLVSELLVSLESNPSKLWVMGRFQPALELVGQEDTEARERFGVALEAIMEALGIESSDGLLAAYLGGV